MTSSGRWASRFSGYPIHSCPGIALTCLGLLLSCSLSALGGDEPDRSPGRTAAGALQRWIPESCELALGSGEMPSATAGGGETAESIWNRFYMAGIRSLEIDDLDAAEQSFCSALIAASSFEARDIRFAETLDELGLVAYRDGDFARAEAMQGAAVAEILLALGPPREGRSEHAERSCQSSVATYLERLGWVYEEQGRGKEIDRLLREPFRIFGRGYIPRVSLDARLEWLVSSYLLLEDFPAAGWLQSLQASWTEPWP